MRIPVRMLGLIMVVGLLQSPVPLQGQPAAPCPTTGAAPPPVTIGHFAESPAEVGRFCRYLVRNRIMPVFQDLGSVRDSATRRRVQAALEASTIHVLWLNPSAIGILASDSSLVMKVLAVTDFPVLHVLSRDPNVRLVTDTAFAPTEVMVERGRSEFYADVLFAAIGRGTPRCLEARIGCEAHPGEGLTGRFVTFLSERPSRAVVLASPTLPPSLPESIVRVVLHTSTEAHLVGIPPQTVAAMQAVPGMMTVVQIPRGHYGLGQNPNVPGAEVPTAAAPIMLVSSTPAEVAARVRELVGRVNEALLRRERRVALRDVQVSLELVRTLGENLGGRLVLHEEYARILQREGLRPGQPPSPPVSPPSVTSPALPAPEIRNFTAIPPVIRAGIPVRLCWVVVNARRVVLDNKELQPGEIANGCRTVFPLETTIYVLRAEGLDGRTVVTREVSVIVIRLPRPATPTPSG